MTTITAATLTVPGASLHYEVRGDGPLVVLVGAPMDATTFEPLADLLADDFTVLTTDPRGINRSVVDDRQQDATVELRADDLARLITHLDAGPATVFGSSGGAVSALALAQTRPELVSTVIAHEPPLYYVLDDADELMAQCEDYIETYFSGDVLGSWRKFMALANIQMPEELLVQIFGGERSPQQVADDDFQNAHMLRPTVQWRPDAAALRDGKPQVVIGIGEESGEQLCDRTSRALAASLGIEPTLFPGDHTGFAGDPRAFAVRLREALSRMSR